MALSGLLGGFGGGGRPSCCQSRQRAVEALPTIRRVAMSRCIREGSVALFPPSTAVRGPQDLTGDGLRGAATALQAVKGDTATLQH